MTNHWNDIQHSDVILIMGGNAAVAHPCGFKYVTEAIEKRKAKVMVVDPRFTQSAALADLYAPIRIGTDIAFLGGVINYLLSNNKVHMDYVKAYTNAPFLIREDYSFEDGLFSGYDPAKRAYDKSTWAYELGKDGFVIADDTLEHPRCAYQLLKKHYSRYTPEMVQKICGTPKDKFLKVAEGLATTAGPDKVATIMYALGWTQHSVGSQNIRTMAIVQLLLGNIGRPGGGVNALRGHANVQGATDQCAFPQSLPGYLAAPVDAQDTREKFVAANIPKTIRPNQMNYGQNFPKWFTSLQKAWYGDNATKENDYCYDWIPKLAGAFDSVALVDRMYQGQINGLIAQGYNPLFWIPNVKKTFTGLTKLKFLVMIDPLKTETGEFWHSAVDYDLPKSEEIKTEVFRLPACDFAEDTGTFANSGRVIQWHTAGQDPAGEGKTDREIMALLFTRLRDMYKKDGGKFPDAIKGVTWSYAIPTNPTPDEVLREINGRALVDIMDPKDKNTVLIKAGTQLSGFGQLQDDGSTACGNWIYCGVYSPAGNLSARRDTGDPGGMGNYLNWGYAWPANRRILYNRANTDPKTGQPWDPKRPGIRWNGTAWVGFDVPDIGPTLGPDSGAGPYIMTNEGVGRLFSLGGMSDGPFPEHYEPFETPIGTNEMHPKVVSNPVARILKSDAGSFGTPDKYPYAATTYRLTEHFHAWTKHTYSAAIVSPRQYIEISEELAKEKNLKTGDMAKLTSPRGEVISAVAVTKRMKPLDCGGKKVHQIGIPIHFGFMGVTKPGYMINLLTPVVADANTQTPEYKAFLVNLEKV